MNHHQSSSIIIWLVVWNIKYFPDIGNVIIPTDFHSIIFQRGWLKPPTRYGIEYYNYGKSPPFSSWVNPFSFYGFLIIPTSH